MRTRDGLMLAFCSAAGIFALIGYIPDWRLVGGVMVFGYVTLACFGCRICHRNGLLRGSLTVLAAVAGMSVFSLAANSQLEHILPHSLENRELVMQGYICSLPKAKPHFRAYEVCDARLAERTDLKQGTMLKGRVRLYAGESVAELDTGNTYRLLVKLKRPHATVNPVGFVYEKYLFRREVVATGSIRQLLPIDGQSDASVREVSQGYWYLRGKLASTIDALLASYKHAGVMRALTLGDKSQLDSQTRDIFAKTSTQHLVAISGLHVGAIVILMLKLLGRWRYGAILAVSVAAIYAAIAGFPVSAQRALIMAAYLLMLKRRRLRTRLLTTWLQAMILVLLWDPLSLLDSGFWFSFLAIAIILLRLHWGRGAISSWRNILKTQLLILLVLGVVVIGYGGQLDSRSVIANLFAIPWVSLVTLPLLILSWVLAGLSNVLADIGFFLTDLSLDFLIEFLRSLDVISYRPVLLLNIGLAATLAVVLAIIVVSDGRSHLIMGIGTSTVILMLMLGGVPGQPESEMLVFDAGQGLAVLARDGSNMWLYDTGPAGEGWSVIRRSVIPYINSLGLRHRFNGVIVSHGDKDHAGGTTDLLQQAEADFWWSGQPQRIAPDGPFNACVRGMHWQKRSADTRPFTVEVLYPGAQAVFSDSNSHSCVVRIKLGEISVLLTGDLGGKAEQAFLQNYRGSLRADVLIAGHHGAASSSSYALLKRVSPRWIVYSSGYLNGFGHPSLQVQKRVSDIGAVGLNTADSGAIRFRISQAGLPKVEHLRQQRSAFWLEPFMAEGRREQGPDAR